MNSNTVLYFVHVCACLLLIIHPLFCLPFSPPFWVHIPIYSMCVLFSPLYICLHNRKHHICFILLFKIRWMVSCCTCSFMLNNCVLLRHFKIHWRSLFSGVQFYELPQTYWVMQQPLWPNVKYTTPKVFLMPLCVILPTHPYHLATTDLFSLAIDFCFSECHINGNI
jgi:hypothetical protein